MGTVGNATNPPKWQYFDEERQFRHCWREVNGRKISAMTEFLVLVALLLVLHTAVMYAGRHLGPLHPRLRKSYRDNFFRPADPMTDLSYDRDADLGRLLAETHRAPHN